MRSAKYYNIRCWVSPELGLYPESTPLLKDLYRKEGEALNWKRFDSTGEAKRFVELALMLKAKTISGLSLQPRFPLIVNECLVCTYIPDFKYRDLDIQADVVEDFKGMKTKEYVVKSALFRAVHPELVFRESFSDGRCLTIPPQAC